MWIVYGDKSVDLIGTKIRDIRKQLNNKDMNK